MFCRLDIGPEALASMEDSPHYKRLANDVYVYGSVSLALAMATETKMIHSLCTAEAPLTSTQTASQLNLKERYVREVLNSLTVAGLVHLEAGTGGKEGQEARYWVPPICRQTLQRAGVSVLSMACSARHFSSVRECFDQKGPDCMSRTSDAYDTLDAWSLAQLDDFTEAVLKTPGLQQRLEQGLSALEVGCGTGRLFLRLAAMYPNSHFTFTDTGSEPLERARKQAEKEGLTNVSFTILNVCQMPEILTETFDWVLSVYVIHDLPHPLKGLQEICRVLKLGGLYSLADLFVSSFVAENVKSYQVAAALYGMSTFNCIPESYQQSDSEAPGACWGIEKATELVEAAGMNVLGLTRLAVWNSAAVCMCQKPE